MKLANVARWGDRTKLYDAYTPSKLVMFAQISSYIDNQLDGAISKRRVISFAPDQTVPPRRVVTYSDEKWIIGDTLVDHWKGKVVRVSAASKKVTGLYRICTGAQAALASAVTSAYGQLLYLKDTVNTLETSAYSPQYEAYFAAGEPLAQSKLIETPTGWLHIRSLYPVLDGFVCAISDDVGQARKAVTLVSKGGYDSATDSHSTTTTATFGMLIDFYKLYGKDTPLTYNQAPGDMTLLLANTVSPKVGETVEIASESWRILLAVLEGDTWRTHIRRAA